MSYHQQPGLPARVSGHQANSRTFPEKLVNEDVSTANSSLTQQQHMPTISSAPMRPQDHIRSVGWSQSNFQKVHQCLISSLQAAVTGRTWRFLCRDQTIPHRHHLDNMLNHPLADMGHTCMQPLLPAESTRGQISARICLRCSF